jgi:hypothetical protein
MPVLVSLIDLVQVHDTAHLWPAAFRAFVRSCEDHPDERTHFAACADWLDEPEVNEPVLARAFRFAGGRRDLVFSKVAGTWCLSQPGGGLDWDVSGTERVDLWSASGGPLVVLMAVLGRRMERHLGAKT